MTSPRVPSRTSLHPLECWRMPTYADTCIHMSRVNRIPVGSFDKILRSDEEMHTSIASMYRVTVTGCHKQKKNVNHMSTCRILYHYFGLVPGFHCPPVYLQNLASWGSPATSWIPTGERDREYAHPLRRLKIAKLHVDCSEWECQSVSQTKKLLLQFTSCSGIWWYLLFYTHFITLWRLSHLRRFRTQSVIDRVPPCRYYRQWELAYTAHSFMYKSKKCRERKLLFFLRALQCTDMHYLTKKKNQRTKYVLGQSSCVVLFQAVTHATNYMPVLISTTRLSLIFLP
jgi:hypothetical protein